MTTNLKKLSINEIWLVYQTLSIGIANPLKGTLMEDVKFILHNTPAPMIDKAIGILYKKKPKYENPVDVILYLTNGLKANQFFDFVEFIRKPS